MKTRKITRQQQHQEQKIHETNEWKTKAEWYTHENLWQVALAGEHKNRTKERKKEKWRENVKIKNHWNLYDTNVTANWYDKSIFEIVVCVCICGEKKMKPSTTFPSSPCIVDELHIAAIVAVTKQPPNKKKSEERKNYTFLRRWWIR